MTTLEADLYETDVVAWAEQQAEALRRRAGGNALDYENLADEIEDVSRTQARAARSYIDVIIEHFLKLELVDQPDNVRRWRASVKHARASLQSELTPTLRTRLPATIPAAVERQIELLIGFRSLSDEAAAPRLEVPYDWQQITGEWLPERTEPEI